jgi:uncharacterized protein (TIGR00369 family)
MALSPRDRKLALAPLFGSDRQDLVIHAPHAQALGMRLVEIAPREATLALPYRPELVGDPVRGVVFGGVITSLLDQAAGLAVHCSLEVSCAIATVDLRIDYLRAAEPGYDLFGRASCTKLTKRVAFIRAIAWEHDPDDPFASCLATFMLGANTTESPYTSLLGSRDENPTP